MPRPPQAKANKLGAGDRLPHKGWLARQLGTGSAAIRDAPAHSPVAAPRALCIARRSTPPFAPGLRTRLGPSAPSHPYPSKFDSHSRCPAPGWAQIEKE